MTLIRAYEEKDRDAVRGVCLATSSIPVGTQAQRAFLWTMYCDYYIEQEPDCCFVAADEEDKAVGYILCARHYSAYMSRFIRQYVPRLLRKNPLSAIAALGEVLAQKQFAAEYPAHMHIDILDDYQRMGLGHRLVDRLVETLRAQGVPGLFLCVGSSNQKGLSFYRKYGFHEVKKLPGSVVMGLKV